MYAVSSVSAEGISFVFRGSQVLGPLNTEAVPSKPSVQHAVTCHIIIIIIIIIIIPVIIGATGTISETLRNYVSNIPGNHEVKELQKTAILGTAHILRKVLM